MSVTNSAPATAAAGDDVTYTITVANNGPDPAPTPALNDSLPPGTTFVSLSQNSGPAASCSTPAPGTGGTVSCSWASLAVGSAQFTLVATIPGSASPGSIVTNVATVSTGNFDPDHGNDSSSASTTVASPPSADLGITQSGPTSAARDSDVTYTIDVTNAGPDAAASVSISDTLPGTMTFVSLSQASGPAATCATPAPGSGGTVTCTLASVAPGAALRLVLTGHIPGGTAGGSAFSNVATVSSTTGGDSPADNSDTETTTTTYASDIAVTCSGPATATVGQQITYAIGVADNGPDDDGDAGFSAVLPAGTTFVSLTQISGLAMNKETPSAGANGTVRAHGTLPAGTSASFKLVVATDGATPGGTQIVITAASTSTNPDPDSSNGSASVTTTLAAAPAGGGETQSPSSGQPDTVPDPPGGTSAGGAPDSGPPSPDVPQVRGPRIPYQALRVVGRGLRLEVLPGSRRAVVTIRVRWHRTVRGRVLSETIAYRRQIVLPGGTRARTFVLPLFPGGRTVLRQGSRGTVTVWMSVSGAGTQSRELPMLVSRPSAR